MGGNCLFRCHQGYIPPFCSPDPLTVVKGEILPMQLNANVSMWAETWGHEKCSTNDTRYVFSKVWNRKSYFVLVFV